MQAVNKPSKNTQELPKKQRNVITNSIQTYYTTFLKKDLSKIGTRQRKEQAKTYLKNPHFQEYFATVTKINS